MLGAVLQQKHQPHHAREQVEEDQKPRDRHDPDMINKKKGIFFH